jgi:hypothetical protein
MRAERVCEVAILLAEAASEDDYGQVKVAAAQRVETMPQVVVVLDGLELVLPGALRY